MSPWQEIRREEILCVLRGWRGPTLAAAMDLRMSVEELRARIAALGIEAAEWENGDPPSDDGK